MNDELVDNLLSAYNLNTLEYEESDGSITFSSVDMALLPERIVMAVGI